MSEVQHTTEVAESAVNHSVEQTTTPEVTDGPTKTEVPTTTEATAVESKPEEPTADSQLKKEAAAAEEKKDETTALPEKVIEPISEGQLTYKGPGLLKSLIPSKKEFWLTDDTTSAEELSSYMRGEKPEISHPIVAWATQTGKGLLFFNKKGETNKKQPGHVLALYDATDLKKQSPHEIIFKIGTHEHTLKATSDAERDGWYMSIEKSVELGKAAKTEIHESEGYKEELEKLNKPHAAATAAAVASKSRRGKSTDASGAESGAEDQKKARSTSRGVLDRFKSKKEDGSADKEATKSEDEGKTEEVAAVAAGTAVVGGAGVAVAEAGSTEEAKKDETEIPAEAVKSDEKAKTAKRGSIFGKMAGWGGMKSPTKEKDAELKPETPAKDEPVAEEAPVLPETATTERTDPEAEADKIETKAENEVAKENETKKEVSTPGKEKSSFLSGLLPKRNRSVSPSANLTKAESEAPKETTEEAAKAEEPATESAITYAADAPEAAKEPAKVETPKTDKRQSVLGSLGRRASKAMGMKKKENVAPTAEATNTATTEEAAAATEVEQPVVNGEAKPAEPEQQPTIGDVVPSAISVGTNEQPPAVTASA